MAMYSSRPPFNDDPEPWLVDGFRATASVAEGQAPWATVWEDPRPEFDRPQNNPTNPILAKYRAVQGQGAEWGELWASGFLAAAERTRFAAWSDEQVEHARRVLTRLARFQEES